MELWVEKHRPRRLSELAGNPKTIARLREWVEEFKDGRASKRALLLHGPPGTGKTTAAYALAHELAYDIIETNASDFRTKEKLERIVGRASQLGELYPGVEGRILLVDEVDGIHGRSDYGGLSALRSIIKQTREPVVLLANNPWSLPPDFRALCEILEFRRIDRRSILKVLRSIAAMEGVSCDEKALNIIATNANGDLRSAINDLQSLGQKGRIALEDASSLHMRDSELTIFKALAQIFKTESCERAREAVYESEEDPETLLSWLVENLPYEYEDPVDLAKAYSHLSRADVFMGRIKRRQDWRLLSYATELMSCGVALSKKRRYGRFIRYRYPEMFALLARTRGSRSMVESIAEKTSKKCHVSSKAAAREFLPFLRILLRDVQLGARVSSYLGLELKEIEFLNSGDAKKIFELAQAMSASRRKRSVQTSLF